MNYINWIRKYVGHQCIFLNFVGCVIFNEKGEILLQKRSDKNKWGFLGGALELGESISEALIREVKEESGLVVEIDGLIGIYTKYFDEYPNGDKAQTITTVFKCKIIGGNLIDNNEETLKLSFFNIYDVPDIVNQQHKDILEDIISKKNNVVR